MSPSFAQIRTALQVVCLAAALALGGCASLPAPTAELGAAQQSVARADAADADQYAPDDIARARSALGGAQAAMARGDEAEARDLAVLAAAAADLAHARSRQAGIDSELSQRRAEVSGLRDRLQMEVPR